MKNSHNHMLGAWSNGVLAFAALLMLIFYDSLDTFGLVFAIGFFFLTSGLAYYNFKKYQAARDEDDLSEKAEEESGIKYYKKMMLLTVISFGAISIWTIVDINNLQSGEVESASLWWPIAFLYSHYGYWPAVLVAPLLGIGLLAIFFFKRKEM